MFVGEEMLGGGGGGTLVHKGPSPTLPPPKTFMAFYRNIKRVGPGRGFGSCQFFTGNLVYMPFSAMRQARSQTRQE